MKIAIKHNSEVPLAEQVERAIRLQIENRELHSGTQLSSIRQLAASLGVGRNTIIEAYDRLVARGLVRSRQGSGYFVEELPHSFVPARGSSNPAEAEDVSGEIWHWFGDQNGRLKLGCGWLPEDWRETEDIAYAIRQVARQDQASLFEYSTPQGSLALRQSLQRRFHALGISVDTHQILLTTGASHALDLLIRYLLSPGDVVFVENPGYYNLFGLLKLQGIEIVGIPQTINGPDPDMLEHMLATYKPKVFFVNGALQNPTGTILSASVAHRVLQLAERFDFMVIEDDVCSDFQSEITVRMAALDQLHRVIYLGSFSKSLSCSLRVGFIAAAPKIIKALTDIKMLTSISSPRFAEEVVNVVLSNGGYRKSIARIRRRLDRQMSVTLRLAESAGWEFFARPSGGMFVWARWHGVADSAVLVKSAATLGVDLSPGALFHPAMGESSWLRINIAYATDPRAVEFISNPLQKRAYQSGVPFERSNIKLSEPKVSGI